MDRIYINNDWKFSETFSLDMTKADFDDSSMKDVRIPHTVKETPLHYFDENDYQMVSGYRRIINVPKSWDKKTVLLTFEGVAHDAAVFVNGTKVGEHHSGYTAFTFDISNELQYGKDNLITVCCDSRESLNIPPFGFVIDYMTYGGIYRDVYLEVKSPQFIADEFITTKLADRFEEDGVLKVGTSQIVSLITLSKEATDSQVVRHYIRKKGEEEFKKLGETELIKAVYKFGETGEVIEDEDLKEAELPGKYKDLRSEKDKFYYEVKSSTGEVELWELDNPARYEIKTELIDKSGSKEKVLDEKITVIGFRRAQFKVTGFFLNGRKVKIRGLNRHQSYPYVGYAMPASMQIRDADILKHELGLNAVRTSHYPQSQDFIDRCDELGLLVFTEFPGWQHIGDDLWKDQAVENAKEMVLQYRNHPSIILWGVRINESVDDDDFYKRTNAVAHALDPSRQTGGVRCYKKGSFLEDVYTYNDFSHSGYNKGCDKKSDVTSDMARGYLVTEYNGHMYPTKPFDWEEHRMEHMRRHANVLEGIASQGDIAGSFGWCMFDYNTHKDFGSGDRICYHGVMDMFRNPKLAAAVYAIQSDERPILEVSSSMEIGEHPGSVRGDVYILTNADSVKMYKNDRFLKEYTQEDSPYTNLVHGPIPITDYIGDTIEENEPDMSKRQAEDLKLLLNEVAKVGLYGVSKVTMAKAGLFSVIYKKSMTDAIELYNKYIGDWGGKSTVYRFEAIKDGEVVKEVTIAPMTKKELSVEVDHTELSEGRSYDVAAVRIALNDEYGNKLPFANDPVVLELTGAAELIGPSIISLAGGMGGTYVRTIGKKGKATLKVKTTTGEEKVIDFKIK